MEAISGRSLRAVYQGQEEQGQGGRAGQAGRAGPPDLQAEDGAGVAQKSLGRIDARELRKLVDNDHPTISVSRQCALLGQPRSTLYYRPTPVRESTLKIMTRIDALYLENSCSGIRRMVYYMA